MNKTIAIYVRVSTEGIKNGHVQDTASQRNDIETYLKNRGVTDFVVYEDKGYSGTKANRPALKQMMQDCRSGKVSMVVCYKLDRLFRSLKNLMDTVNEFVSLNVEFVAVKDNIDLSSATGRLLFQIIGSFAEFEAACIRERVISGIANAKSKGIQLGRPKKVGRNVVKNMIKQGKSVKEIANHTGMSRMTVYRELKEV